MTDVMAPEDGTLADLVHVEEDALARAEPEGDGRRVLIRLLRWDETTSNTQEGVTERFARGAFRGVDPSTVTIEAQRHGGPIVGIGESIEERDDGAYLWARISQTRDGDDLLTLVRDKVLRAASVVFRPFASGSRQRADGVVERTRVDLARVAVLDRGAYKSAAVVAVRQAQEADMAAEPIAEAQQEAPPITPEPVAAPEPAQEDPVPPTPVLVERAAPVDLAPLTGRIEAVEQRMAVLAATPSEPAAAVPELFRLGSLSEYVERARNEEVVTPGGHPDPAGLRWAMAQWLQREVADQITTNNAGVVPPAWLNDVKGIVDLGRPTINALGGAQPLPPEGMEIDWPYVSSSNTVIGVQSTQKTEVTSARIDIGKGSSNLVTYAGVSDISVQLLKRSRPSYRAAYDRIMLAAWAAVTDNAFADAIDAAGTAATYGWDADTTGQNLKKAVFAASVQVETATGLPASVVLCATDVFAQLGTLSEIVPPTPAGNPSNASGTLHAASLQVSVAGLPFVHSRGLATGRVIVTNSLAAQWFEDGPFSMAADDATLLGTDVAWYSFGAAATFVAAGIVKLFGPGASGS